MEYFFWGDIIIIVCPVDIFLSGTSEMKQKQNRKIRNLYHLSCVLLIYRNKKKQDRKPIISLDPLGILLVIVSISFFSFLFTAVQGLSFSSILLL